MIIIIDRRLWYQEGMILLMTTLQLIFVPCSLKIWRYFPTCKFYSTLLLISVVIHEFLNGAFHERHLVTWWGATLRRISLVVNTVTGRQ